ncbi:MAG: hypothetical protein CL942_04180 [Desulfovibrio sp.]|nr:hypothetical protein [Desulfovibrio sp.]|tara:strand:+ start:1509 stop:1802 length:294 start_codon:yes stop_codon:yes gene_type:complete
MTNKKERKVSPTAQMLLQNYPVLLTFQQIEEITGISLKTIHGWKNKGCLPFQAKRIGRTWRVHVDQVAELIDSFNSKERKRKPGRPRKEEQYEATGR